MTRRCSLPVVLLRLEGSAAFALSILFYSRHNGSWLLLALIWTAHIGIDRAIGYGLKYPTNFVGHASVEGVGHRHEALWGFK